MQGCKSLSGPNLYLVNSFISFSTHARNTFEGDTNNIRGAILGRRDSKMDKTKPSVSKTQNLIGETDM